MSASAMSFLPVSFRISFSMSRASASVFRSSRSHISSRTEHSAICLSWSAARFKRPVPDHCRNRHGTQTRAGVGVIGKNESDNAEPDEQDEKAERER
jgi:hypothetical protein